MSRPPKAKGVEPFAMIYLRLFSSKAWQVAAGINTKRLVDALVVENGRHAGKRNGRLVLPHRQLEAVIGARLIGAAIAQAETLGLIECKHGVGRAPNEYTLNCLPLGDGSAPNMRFLSSACDEAADAVIAARREAKRRHGKTVAPHLRVQQQPLVPVKGEAQGHPVMPHLCTNNASQMEGTTPLVPVKGEAQSAQSAVRKGEAPYIWPFTMAGGCSVGSKKDSKEGNEVSDGDDYEEYRGGDLRPGQKVRI